jgi:hypothetical protein
MPRTRPPSSRTTFSPALPPARPRAERPRLPERASARARDGRAVGGRPERYRVSISWSEQAGGFFASGRADNQRAAQLKFTTATSRSERRTFQPDALPGPNLCDARDKGDHAAGADGNVSFHFTPSKAEVCSAPWSEWLHYGNVARSNKTALDPASTGRGLRLRFDQQHQHHRDQGHSGKYSEDHVQRDVVIA